MISSFFSGKKVFGLQKGIPGTGYYIFFVILFFSFVLFPLVSQENNNEGENSQSFFNKISWFGVGSVLFFPEDNGNEGGPMPVLPSPGLGISYPLNDFFRLEASLDLYYTHYGYSYNLSRPVPDEIENRTAQVIGFVLAVEAAWYYELNSLFTLRVFGGPAADLRLVLVAGNLSNETSASMDDIRSRTDKVRSYFWSSGRWLMPVAGVGTDFKLNSRFKLGVDFRVWMPMYKLWTGEDLPAVEGWRFGPGIRFTIL